MTFHQCPVCLGAGRVPRFFYSASGLATFTSDSTGPLICQSCFGSGKVADSTEQFFFSPPTRTTGNA